MSVDDSTIFMQDGAPCHCSKIVADFFRVNKITLLEWPGNSPDFNITESLWAVFKDEVADKHPSNISALIKAIKLVWIHDIPEEFRKNLIEIMPRRMKVVIKAKEELTNIKNLLF